MILVITFYLSKSDSWSLILVLSPMSKTECRKEGHPYQQEEKEVSQETISDLLSLGILTMVGTGTKIPGWQLSWGEKKNPKSDRNSGKTLDLDFPFAGDTTLGKPLNISDLSLLICQCVP